MQQGNSCFRLFARKRMGDMITGLFKYMAFLSVLMLLGIPVVWGQEVCAHRGEHLTAPENTIPSIRSAIREGVRQVEIDVKTTRDGTEVLMHDWTVDRTTNGSGNVAELTFAEIRMLDAGSWFDISYENIRVPTLQEALAVIPDEVAVNVHVHGGVGTVVRTAEIIEGTGHLEHCFLTLGMDAYDEMAAARLAVPSIRICKGHPADSTVTREDTLIPADAFEQAGNLTGAEEINRTIDYVQLFGAYESPEQLAETVKALQGLGVTVNFCCANTADQIIPLIDAGVDYILTDEVKLCKEVLEMHGNGEGRLK